MLRKLLALSLIGCFMMQSFSVSVKAEEKDFFENSVILLVDSPMCYVNGKMKPVGDVAPTILNDRTLVPVRFLTESFGGTVQWNDDTKTAVLNYGDDIIDVPVGENKIVVNGESRTLDVGAAIVSDRTMLPVRAISEALGKVVGYNDGIISLTDNDVEKYDENSPYSGMTMNAIRKKLSLEKEGKTIIKPTSFTFDAMESSAGVLTFSEKDIPYVSKTDSYVVTGNIYIENLTIKEHSETERKMTFDAYNYDYVHGIVEVYDEEDNLKSYKMIEPFGGTWTSLTEYGVAVYNMGVSISDWIATGNSAYFTYRNKTQTQHTPIEVIVPKNGYVHITSNPSVSEALCVYDTTRIITQSIALAVSTLGITKDSELMTSFTGALEEKITDSVSEALKGTPELYSELLRILAGEVDAVNTDASAKSLSDKVITLFTGYGINILKDAEELAAKMLFESAEEAAKGAAGLFVDKGISKALNSMSLINTASDYVCFMLDIQYSTSKRSLILKLTTDELDVYRGVAKFPGKTISGTSSGLILTDAMGEKKTLVPGDFEYISYVTDGSVIYYHDKNALTINRIDLKSGKNEKVSDVFIYFDSYFNNPVDWPRESCLSSGGIAAYYNGKIYFEECGGFEIYPMATVDIKTGEYKLTPLRNIGRLDFYGDNMYYMIQTGSFDLWPLHVADADGNNSRIFKNDVWKFEIYDNIMYACTGLSQSYEDYDKGNIYKIDMDTGAEELIAQNIKPSTEFENFVAKYHENN